MERNVLAADLMGIEVKECFEPLEPLINSKIIVSQIGDDMRPYTGDKIYVRRRVASMLGEVALNLPTELQLQIVYGYRALNVQQQYFETALARQDSSLSEWDKIEAAHREIAYPLVAGHPTGGAVDVQMIDKLGKPLDFGTPIWSFVPESATFSSGMTKLQMTNRLILREAMMAAGFAPFDGEWWHFSFGDREWAFFYEQPEAVYEQLPPRKQI